MKGRDLLNKGMRLQVGNGKDIKVWDDPWFPLPVSFKPFSIPIEGSEDMRVEDLINSTTGEWEHWLLEDMFSEFEANKIRSIPLCLNGGEDRWMWHYDKKGVFSVRSGYQVARKMQSMETRASTSGGCGGRGAGWNVLWRVNVPPKVKMHVWRLWKGILPTKIALSKKGVVTDMKCPFCGVENEDDIHLFKNCGVVAQLWKISPVQLRPELHPVGTMAIWLRELMMVLHGEQLEFFFLTLWAIWVERNNVVWRNGCFVPINVASWLTGYLEEYKRVHSRRGTKKKRPPAKWVSPPSGRLKINVDGSFLSDHGKGGYGVVVRDCHGDCQAVVARHLPFLQNAMHAEAEAIRAGLQLAIHEGWESVEVETDCEVVVNALEGEMEDLTEIGRIIDECKRCASSFSFLKFRHVFREANGVAHRLAHLASSSSLDGRWFKETPAIIRDVVFEDSYNAVRGYGLEATPVYYQMPINNNSETIG